MSLKHIHEAVERVELSIKQFRREAVQSELLTIEEAADYLRISMEQMYTLTAKKTFTLYKPGGKLAYILREDLKAWVLAAKIPSAAEIDKSTNSLLLQRKAA